MNPIQKLTAGVGVVVSFAAAVVHVGVLHLADLQALFIPLAYQLAPEVAFLDERMLQDVALAVTAAFVAFSLFRLVDSVLQRFRKS